MSTPRINSMVPPHPVDALRGRRGSHLQGQRIALGVDAVRGAPGAVRIARELARLGAEVHPLVEPAALDWVPAAALEYATGHAPQAWPTHASYDAVLLAPCGPHLARKLALGLPDTAPSAAALAHLGRAPVLAAPAPGLTFAVGGVEVLRDAFDAHGAPRAEDVAAAVAGARSASRLRGLTCLVVGGGAQEPMDAMRVVATRGDAAVARGLALELRRRGAVPHVMLGPWGRPHRAGETPFTTTRELHAALAAHAADVALIEDALPRFAPAPQAGKLRSGQQGLALALAPVPDAMAGSRARVRVAWRAGEGSLDEQAARIARQAEDALA